MLNKSHTRTVILLSSVVFFPAVSATGQTAPNAPTHADEFYKDVTKSFGGNGGKEIKEDASKYLGAPITAIRVCHGSLVDSVWVTYGRSKGVKIGGNGGKCENVTMEIGDRITGVRVRAGSAIDRLQFQINGTWDSKIFGGTGGTEYSYISESGGQLAYIEGYTGSRIDKLSFTFGMPYEIEKLRYDKRSVEQQKNNAETKASRSVCYTNLTSVEQQGTFTDTLSLTETTNWNFGTSFEWGVSTDVSAEIPGVATFSVSANVGGSTTKDKGGEKGKTQEFSWGENPKIPAGQNVLVESEYSEKTISIPFKYRLIHINNAGERIPSNKEFSGSYQGVSFKKGSVSYTPVALCPNNAEKAELKGKPGDMPAPPVPAPTPDPLPAVTPQAPSPMPAVTPNPNVTPMPVSATTLIYGTNGGQNTVFKQNDYGDWEELSADTSEVRFSFIEMDRDETAIYLMDIDRGVLITLNITQKEITYAPDDQTPMSKLYSITSIE